MSQLAAYKDNSVSTQNKGRLIVLLYDGAIKFLKLAIKELESGNQEAKGQYINRAADIITELNAIRKLYTFMSDRLTQANIKQDPNMVRDVIKLMEELNQGWRVITG